MKRTKTLEFLQYLSEKTCPKLHKRTSKVEAKFDRIDAKMRLLRMNEIK